MNGPDPVIGAQPDLFTSRTRGNVIWLSEKTDTVYRFKAVPPTQPPLAFVVTFQEVKVLLCNRERKISGTLGKPMSMN